MTLRPVLVALCLCLGAPVMAEVRDEDFVVSDKLVRISTIDKIEVMTAGPDDLAQMQVLSGADVEVVAIVADAEGAGLLGAPVLVATVTGSHSCEDLAAEALLYFVVTLGDEPAPEGPVSTCGTLAVSVLPGAIVLEADPMESTGAFWAWSPGMGFRDRLE